jgi:hypothetical protein
VSTKRTHLPKAIEAARVLGDDTPADHERWARRLYGRVPLPLDEFVRLADAYDLGPTAFHAWAREIAANRRDRNRRRAAALRARVGPLANKA